MNPPTQEQDKTPEQIWAELDAEESGAPIQPVTIETTESKAETESAAAAGEQPAEETPKDNAAEGDRIAGLESTIARLEQRLRQAEGKYGELNSIVRQSQVAAQAVREAGGEAPSAREIADAKGSAEKFAKLKADYPDFAEAIEEFVVSRQPAMPFDPNELRAQIAEERAALDLERRKLRVEIRHPGWEDEIKTAQFAGWLDRQQPEVKMLADSNEPAAAIRVMDLFRAAHPKRSERPDQDPNLQAAAALPGSRRQSNRPKPVEEMTDEEYWRYLDAQDAAAASAKR